MENEKTECIKRVYAISSNRKIMETLRKQEVISMILSNFPHVVPARVQYLCEVNSTHVHNVDYEYTRISEQIAKEGKPVQNEVSYLDHYYKINADKFPAVTPNPEGNDKPNNSAKSTIASDGKDCRKLGYFEGAKKTKPIKEEPAFEKPLDFYPCSSMIIPHCPTLEEPSESVVKVQSVRPHLDFGDEEIKDPVVESKEECKEQEKAIEIANEEPNAKNHKLNTREKPIRKRDRDETTSCHCHLF
eukprot:TRINITY_DN10893_c0_g2_i2.p2 TRINITY_DN10893_c0_g2~~TRINITY_DN10893_c0_g2_i2.p2  ORF type:complete len:245 (-),score=48.27 TRINITY_DN10893_c0_g2_i2:92-826(-)